MHTYTKMTNRTGGYLIVASFLILAACSSKSDTPVADEGVSNSEVDSGYTLSSTQFKSSGMKLGKLEMQAFHEVVKANGMFDVPPENLAAVSTYFGGTVKDIRLLPGERVKKGQVLFILENPEYVQLQQDYLEAKGQLTYLKSDYERQKNLAQDNVASQKSYLKAESEYTVTHVKVESLSKKLSLMNINPNALSLETIRTTVNVVSPLAGYITNVNITKGTYLNPSETAISIVDTDHLHLELNVFEKDLLKVKIGQRIQFKLLEDDNKEYKASVHLVNKTVDAEKRTVGLHGHLMDENLSDRFTPGMYVEAEIYTRSESRAALPQDALVEVEGNYYVLVLESSSSDQYYFVKKEVSVGLSSNGFIEILNAEDFNENAEFLVIGAFNLITE